MAEGKGLPRFLSEIISGRDQISEEEIIRAAFLADKEMTESGIIAVGDICNALHSIHAKRESKLLFHNFIEVFASRSSAAEKAYDDGIFLRNEFCLQLNTNRVSLAPHAPYSLSLELLKKINDCTYADEGLLTLHNQETSSEDSMFTDGSGELAGLMNTFIGNEKRRWPTGFSSLASTLVHLPRCNKILLVHNTYTQKKDVDWVKNYSDMVWWCLCPNANLFIENRLPDVTMLAQEVSDRITIGTDSYASNWSLSVLDEIKTLSERFPEIPLEELIRWASKNGAEFLGVSKTLGTIEKGKKPGLNHLVDVDLQKLKLQKESKVITL
jgi:cytosine/adenosine deaminase-related metal-dependent hydrolase